MVLIESSKKREHVCDRIPVDKAVTIGPQVTSASLYDVKAVSSLWNFSSQFISMFSFGNRNSVSCFAYPVVQWVIFLFKDVRIKIHFPKEVL